MTTKKEKLKDDLEDTKRKLQSQIEEIEEEEENQKRQKERNSNYEKFKNRESDWVIGKAHCDISVQNIDNTWNENQYKIGECISIKGNCGEDYNANTSITSATNTYFHNVWTDEQRASFQKRLNEVALEEITKIMNTVEQKLEIMGLQNNSFYLNNIYPENKVSIVKNGIWRETIKELNKHSDKEFLDLLKQGKEWIDGNGKKIKTQYEVNLSHSRRILFRYIREHRKNLIKHYEKIRHWRLIK